MMMTSTILLFILLLLPYYSAYGAQRWYYTGKFQNDKVDPTNEEIFPGQVLDYDQLYTHPTDDNLILIAGGHVMSGLYVQESRINITFNLKDEAIAFIDNITRTISDAHFTNIEIISAVSYNIYLSPNYAKNMVMEAEVGLFDHPTGQYIERYWSNITVGTIHAVMVNALTGQGVDRVDYSQRIMYTVDVFNRIGLMQHTWSTSYHPESITCQFPPVGDSRKVRIMTYNLWHNNPPSWVYHEKKKRWDRYHKRLLHFAKQIVEQKAEIVAIQEVRLDSAFYSPSGAVSYWSPRHTNNSKSDSGSQVEHLLSAIHQERMRVYGSSNHSLLLPSFQVIYQPAMLQSDRQKIIYRNEEGVLILSTLPIVKSEVLFLYRQLSDNRDDHQRVLLTTFVDISPSPSCLRATLSGEKKQKEVISVSTSHFSLFEGSRDISAALIRSHLDHSGREGLAIKAEILAGDFNAEPHETAIHRLLDEQSSEADKTSQSSSRPFVDLWTALHDVNNLDMIEEQGLTFPACKPIKRIDYLLLRGNEESAVTAETIFVAGQNPTEDTKHLLGSREDLGMNDLDSPLWASDHFALVADLKISTTRV